MPSYQALIRLGDSSSAMSPRFRRDREQPKSWPEVDTSLRVIREEVEKEDTRIICHLYRCTSTGVPLFQLPSACGLEPKVASNRKWYF